MGHLYFKNWYDEFLKEVENTKILKVISPFIKEQVIRKIQTQFKLKNFKLVTRFSLKDFASGVSSLDALRLLAEEGASVYGVRDVHSKIYLFDERLAIISSANLTSGGLLNNYECGIRISDPATIGELHAYFNSLANIAPTQLTTKQCEQWQTELDAVSIQNTDLPALPDYGALPTVYEPSRGYYVKFFGTSSNRESLMHTVKDEIEAALCHYACGFPANKQPWQPKTGDIIYMARMTYNPNDYAIFGKATAISYVPGRDKFTKAEMDAREWKKNWPIYLRVKNGVFIDATMGDCVFLFDLMKTLDYESFPTTKERYDSGERNINPKLSLARQPYVRLTQSAVEWLEPRFQAVLSRFGAVSQSYISRLPQSPIVVTDDHA
jgi:hypothetical protein